MKFEIYVFFEILLVKFNFYQNVTKITDTLREDRYTFLIISHEILPRMKNVSDKCCRETLNTQFISRIFFFFVRKSYHL